MIRSEAISLIKSLHDGYYWRRVFDPRQVTFYGVREEMRRSNPKLELTAAAVMVEVSRRRLAEFEAWVEAQADDLLVATGFAARCGDLRRHMETGNIATLRE